MRAAIRSLLTRLRRAWRIPTPEEQAEAYLSEACDLHELEYRQRQLSEKIF